MAKETFEREKRSGEPTYRLWGQKVRAALEWRRGYWNGDETWRRGFRLYKGDHWNSGWDYDMADFAWMFQAVSSSNPRDQITVNRVNALVRDFVAFLVAGEPYFIVKPKRAQAVDSAKAQGNLLNYEWREHAVTEEIEKVAYDMAIIGHGVVKTGYEIELDESAVDPKKGVTDYDKFIRYEEPWARRVNPFWFVWDPEAPDLSLRTARWAAEIIFRPIQDIVDDERYSKTVRRQIAQGVESITTVKSFLNARGDLTGQYGANELEKLSRGVLYEVWDWKFKKRYVFADGIEKPLVEDDWPHEYLDGFPYLVGRFIYVPDDPFGIGIPFLVEDQQFELNDLRSKNFAHRRKFNRMYQLRQNSVEPSEIQKLERGEDGTVIITNEDQPIHPVEDAPESIDVDRTEQRINLDMEHMSGADQLIQSGRLPSRTSATEVNRRVQIFGRKIDLITRSLDRVVLGTGIQMLQHIKANFTRTRVIQKIGVDGVRAGFEELSINQIREDVGIEVKSTVAKNVDPMMEKTIAIQLLGVVAQLLQIVGPGLLQMFNIVEFVRWIMEKFEIPDLERFFPAAGTLPPEIASLQEEMERAQIASQGGNAGAPPLRVSATSSESEPYRTGANANSNPIGALLGFLGNAG